MGGGSTELDRERVEREKETNWCVCNAAPDNELLLFRVLLFVLTVLNAADKHDLEPSRIPSNLIKQIEDVECNIGFV